MFPPVIVLWTNIDQASSPGDSSHWCVCVCAETQPFFISTWLSDGQSIANICVKKGVFRFLFLLLIFSTLSSSISIENTKTFAMNSQDKEKFGEKTCLVCSCSTCSKSVLEDSHDEWSRRSPSDWHNIASTCLDDGEEGMQMPVACDDQMEHQHYSRTSLWIVWTSLDRCPKPTLSVFVSDPARGNRWIVSMRQKLNGARRRGRRSSSTNTRIHLLLACQSMRLFEQTDGINCQRMQHTHTHTPMTNVNRHVYRILGVDLSICAREHVQCHSTTDQCAPFFQGDSHVSSSSTPFHFHLPTNKN